MADDILPPIIGTITFDILPAESQLDELKFKVAQLRGEMGDDFAASGAAAKNMGKDLHDGATIAEQGVKDLTQGTDKATKAIKKSGQAATETGGLFQKLGRLAQTFGFTIGNVFTKIGTKVGGEQKRINALGSGWQKFSTVSTVALTATAGALAAWGVDMAQKTETYQAKIAGAGATTEEAARQITTAFSDLSGKTFDDTEEMTKAYANVVGQLTATKGHALDTAQAFSFMSAATQLADASGASLTGTTKALAGVLQAYHVQATQATKYTGALYVTAKGTGQTVTRLATMLGRLKSTLGVLAPTLNQASAFMLDLAKHGESGRQAMSAAQSAFSKLTTTLPKTQAALAKVGVTAFTSSGQFVGIGDVIAQLQPKLKGLNEEQQLNYLRTIFGTAANKKMLETVLGGPAAFNAATRAVSDHNTVTKAATEAMNTLSGSMKVLSGELKDLVQKWGQELLPVVKGAIHIFTDVVKVIEHNKVVAFALAAVIGGILTAAVLTFIWTAGSKMVKTIGEMSESIGKLVVKCGEGVASMLGLGEAGEISGAEMAAGLAIGTLGIAVVIAGLYELWKHWKTVFKFIEDIAKKAWETLKQGFTIFLRFWERLWGDAEQMVVSVWHAIDDVFHSIQQAFSDVVDFIRAHWELIVAILLAPFVPILAAVVLFHDQIIGFFRDIYDTIVSIWQSLVTGLKHAWDDVTGFFTGLWSNYIWPAIKTVITDFEHLGTTIIHALLGGMKQAWNDVTSWFSSALHGIASFFGFGSSSTTTSINGSLGPVTKNVTAVINKIMSGASGGTSGQVGYLPHHASTAAAITITVHAPVTLTGQKIATTISTKVRVNMLSNKGRQTYNLYGGSAGRFSPTGG